MWPTIELFHIEIDISTYYIWGLFVLKTAISGIFNEISIDMENENMGTLKFNKKNRNNPTERSCITTNDDETKIFELAQPELDKKTPDIHKIHIELIMWIFNVLPFEDLNSVFQAYKWWQKVACARF